MVLTYKQKFNKKYKQPLNKSNSIKDIARLTGYEYKGLKTIYNKGAGAWESNLSSVRLKGSFKKNPNTKKFPRGARLGKEQWAMARLYAGINPRSKAYRLDKGHLKKKAKK